MTNHWADIANSTFVLVWGANPAENHPACIAHVNRARFPKQFFAPTDPRSKKTGAKMIVIDPRQTRTALMVDPTKGDRYVRIRPGTDIALENGLLRYIIAQMESPTSSVAAAAKTAFFALLNQSGNGTFYTDGTAAPVSVTDESVVLTGTAAKSLVHAGLKSPYVVKSSDGLTTYAATDYAVDAVLGTIARTSASTIPDGATVLVSYAYGTSALVTNVAGASKYTDARFLVNATGDDYQRETLNPGTGRQITDFPIRAASVTANANTVYNRLKAHVSPYTTAVVANICGCTEADITFVGNAIIENSRCSGTFQPAVTDMSVTMTGTTPQSLGATLLGGLAVNVTDSTGTIKYTEGTDYTLDLAAGTITRKATGSAITDGQVCLVDISGTYGDPRNPGYRAMTMLYAMGQTQHTYGAQNIKGFANIQSLMGNMGRAGGGINALRGIHNVQGSTDMGLLFGNIPAYSSNPKFSESFGEYMDGLWGNPLSGTTGTTDFTGTARAKMDGSHDDAYNPGAMGLQQRGFYNMTLKWFGNYKQATDATTLAARKALLDAAYSLWPKGNGDDHISMFRAMGAETTKALVCWGQNPAVTEPNQGAIRTGLYKLDTLVCVDMFETETAAASRKPGGVTFLLPTAAHVEKAGSAVNSGRTAQWRYQAALPSGNCKEDTEYLLRLAKALDANVVGGSAFSHIYQVWSDNGITYDTSAYKQLYGNPYGGYTGTGTGFAGLSGYAEKVTLRPVASDPLTYVGTTVVDESVTLTGTAASSLANTAGLRPVSKVTNTLGTVTYSNATDYVVDYAAGTVARRTGSTIPDGATVYVSYAYNETVTGSEWVAESVYREMNLPVAAGGTIWIYTGAYNNTATCATDNKAASQVVWPVMNRAKSRDNTDYLGQLQFWGWGYSWLVNRRVFYNNSDVLGDVADFYMEPESCAHMFTPTNAGLLNYSRWYRHNHTMKDVPSPVLAGDTTSPHYAGNTVSLAGRFPGHTEPYETPRQDLAAASKWGRNTKGTVGNAWDLVKADTRVAGRGYTIAGGKPVNDPPASAFPLVLTSIRCVEHFQGGPITRNNWWNVELEPEPWIEINSANAKYSDGTRIYDGDHVRVVTARMVDDTGATVVPASYGQGFVARVGSGLTATQKVAPGTVAIPWHWGEKGLSTGSRANDLCIDAADANSVIPEYKACLCRLEKIS